MALHIHFVDCLVCRQELGITRDRLRLDKIEEEGGRIYNYVPYPLPPARMRDRIAPDICDQCWSDHRRHVLDIAHRRRRGGSSGYYYIPPFNQVYLWSWVATQLEEEAKRLGKETQRLRPHLAEKADRGKGIIHKGPLRTYGPRKIVYRRGFAA